MPVKKRRRRRRSVKSRSFIDRLFFGNGNKKRRAAKKKSAVQVELDAEVISAIWGVVFLTAAILFALSFFGALGVLSNLILGVFMPVFGWGIYAVPVICGIIGVLILLQKQPSIDLAKIAGVVLFFVCGLGILHLSIPIEQIGQFATEGSHGGFVGYLSNYFLRVQIGMNTIASAVIYLAGIFIGLLLTFERTIMDYFGLLFDFDSKKRTKKSKSKKVNQVEEVEPFMIPEAVEEEDALIQIIKPDFSAEKVDEPLNGSAAASVPVINDETTDQQALPLTDNNSGPEADSGSATLVEELKTWEYPPLSLLDDTSSRVVADDKSLKKNAELIRSKLEQFGIRVIMKNVHVGPTVTQYTLKPSEGVKLSKITNLKNDLALALAAKSIRIEAPIPGKSLVGIEVPADDRIYVYLREMLLTKEFQELGKTSQLLWPLGRDVSGKPIIADIATMPHLLIAGATGSGKSVGMNSLLISLLYQNSPSELRLILIDPKRVELSDYNAIPHLLTPVITDPDKAANALNWCVAEMMQRYETLAQAGCRNITEYNSDLGREKKMPKIVVVIDELADLMLSNGKDVEQSICRIAQMARAVGIHLIIATQRPSVDVITGLIKANIPTRVAFAVTSGIDSRTILDGTGAEDLLGQGDMLFLPKDLGKPVRIQGVFVTSAEIKSVTNKVKLTMEPDYRETVVEKQSGSGFSADGTAAAEEEDALYGDALKVVIEHQRASASLLQRRLKIGYARAARILDLLEENGVVGPVNGAKPREILIGK